MLFSPSKKLKNIHNDLVLHKKGMETCLGHWSFLVQEMGDLTLTRYGALSPKQPLPYSGSVMQRLGPPKKKNKTLSDPGLPLCADRVFVFVQETGDLKLAL